MKATEQWERSSIAFTSALMLLAILLITFMAYKIGSTITCGKSDGVLLDTGECVNISSMGYCVVPDRPAFMKVGQAVTVNLTTIT